MARDVITVSAQMGSGGDKIAREVARQLRFRFYDREVISRAAEMSGVAPETVAAAERWPSFVERIMERLTTTVVTSDELLVSPNADSAITVRSSTDYRRLIEEVIRNLAREGDCVIVGHAGQVVLCDSPDVFKVLVHGSLPARAMALADSDGLAPEDAVQMILADDNKRSKFFKCAYGTEWLSSTNYDLTINGGEVDLAHAADWVINGLQARERQLVPA